MITFTFNGIRSEDMGVHVKVQPQHLIPEMRIHQFNIDGYEGTKTARIGRDLLEETFEIIIEGQQNLDPVIAWLMGEGKFTRSDVPGRYRHVAFLGQNDFTFLHESDNGIYEATLTMTIIDPYWHSDKSEDKEYEISWYMYHLAINNEGSVYSQPIITLINVGSTSRVTMKSPWLTISYTYPYGEKEVDIDLKLGTATYKGSPRDRFLTLQPNGDVDQRTSRSLLIGWDERRSNPEYRIAVYPLADTELENDVPVTILLKGELGKDRSHFAPYNSGGQVGIPTLDLKPEHEVEPGYYYRQGRWRTKNPSTEAANNRLEVYQFVNGKTSISTIEELYLREGHLSYEEMREDGNKPTEGFNEPRLEVGWNAFKKVEGDFKAKVKNKDNWY